MPEPIKIATFYVVAAGAVVGITTMYVLHEIRLVKKKVFN